MSYGLNVEMHKQVSDIGAIMMMFFNYLIFIASPKLFNETKLFFGGLTTIFLLLPFAAP